MCVSPGYVCPRKNRPNPFTPPARVTPAPPGRTAMVAVLTAPLSRIPRLRVSFFASLLFIKGIGEPGEGMDSLQKLVKKAQNFKMEGYSDKEIAAELNVTRQTASWLITKGAGAAGEKPPVDASVGWRSVGVFPHRLFSVAEIIQDIIQEELKDMDKVDSIVAVPTTSIPIATLVALQTEKELIMFKFPEEDGGGAEGPGEASGSIFSNFARAEGKNVVVVDDVVGTGTTMRTVIGSLRDHGANPVLAVVMVNKTAEDNIADVPLRALYRVSLTG
jgi:orotate phosphoribosyltransferase